MNRDKQAEEELSLEAKRAIAAVNTPVLTANLIHGNQLLIQVSGKPRAGTTREFTAILDELANERPTDITLEETTVVTRIDTAMSTYLFSHAASDLAALQQYADRVLQEFEKRAFSLPTPAYGVEFQMVVRTEPDRPGQLNLILDRLEEFAERNPGAVNLIALNGRRYYQGKPGAKWYSLLRFVLSIPEEVVHSGPDPSLEWLEKEIEAIGEQWREKWSVKIRPYNGQFMDVLADRYE